MINIYNSTNSVSIFDDERLFAIMFLKFAH